MAFVNDLICTECKYRISVSGNSMKGMLGDISRVYSFECIDCKIVQDIFWDDIPRDEICCKDCRGKNLKNWDGSCPKCGGEMGPPKIVHVHYVSEVQDKNF